MKIFEKALKASSLFEKIDKAKRQQAYPIQINGCVDTQICHMMELLGEDANCRLIVTYSEERARKLAEDLSFFADNVMYYPAKDVLFYSADVHGNAIVNQRLEVVRCLLEHTPVTVVTTIDGGLDRLLPLSVFEQFVVKVKVEEELSLTAFTKHLVELGYQSSAMVEQPGQFALRGGILDVFPLGEECPYRIELWGDEVDTIRSFDVESQRSMEQFDEIVIYPATELPLDEAHLQKGKEAIETEFDIVSNNFKAKQMNKEWANIKRVIGRVLEDLEYGNETLDMDSFITYFYDDTVSFFDYFITAKAPIFYEEPSWLRETAENVRKEFDASMLGRLEGGYMLSGQGEIFWTLEQLYERVQNGLAWYFSRIAYEDPVLLPNATISVHCQRTDTYSNHFELLVNDLTRWKKEGYAVVLISASTTRAKRLAKELSEEGLSAYFVDKMVNEVIPGEIGVTTGGLTAGFLYVDEKLAILSEDDVIKQKSKKRKRTKPRYKGEVIKSFDDISIGDYVVHEDRGVGIYRGIVQKEQGDVVKDYIAIEYANGAMYYIVVSQMEKVQRYSGGEGHKPKINKLGGNEWEKTKTRVLKQVGVLAKELVKLYAIRQNQKGYACEPDNVWQTEFEEMFPYEETNDQLNAIAETKKDMESTKIMDRLICGDVGYGKTEIALRAAFKAVNNSKQVVYLVPTTVLAQQHYNTFCERMKDYPVTIGLLSRFCTPKQQRETIDKLRRGEMDIVIGTHRVFSKDITYKDLGLLIIDEEQRFGVAHKEKIKQMKKDVDVLTLSATPIPRTLHMSLSGIRDMSLLSEAPVNRHAIQTYVMEYNEEMVKEAIKREIARGGQVYYVFNRVKNIEETAAQIQKLVPGARVGYGHGKMTEHQLERVMMDFTNKEIDVLVATTIIETGIDIPNVNTIIIHDADTFGLSQLYQLRGRVGRSSRRAYAFMMYRRDKMIQETAQKRLAAIREFTDLGSGFKIAMRDLEIRGAGNVLGEDQSGHMEAVGYDLYCKMLNQAVAEMKGDAAKVVIDTIMDVSLDAFIPATYVKNEYQKLELYKRIAGIETADDYEDFVDELIDRYGELPEPATNLLNISLLKHQASNAYITKIRQNNGELQVNIYQNAPVDLTKMEDLIRSYKGKVRLVPEKDPCLVYRCGHLKPDEIVPVISKMVEGVQGIMEEAEKDVEKE